MPKEGDRKTTKGLLKSRDKVEDILGTLANIDPETDDVQIELKRARGIGEALKRVLFRLDEVIQHVSQGRPVPQMTLNEVLNRAFTAVPTLRDEDREAIRSAAERGPSDDGEESDDEDEEDDEDDNPAASNAVSFFAPPAIVAQKLAAVGRQLPEAFIATWPPEARAAALNWANNRSGGGSAAVPEVLGRRYVEDLDLSTAVGRVELMVWLRIASQVQLEAVRQGLDVPEFASNDWDDVREWAIAANRHDRGELSVRVPIPPHILLPTGARMAAIKETLSTEGENSIEDLVAHGFFDMVPATFLAVEALVQASEIVMGDDAKLHAARPDLVASEEDLFARARDIATRGTLNSAPEEEGETEDATPEEVEPAATADGELAAEGEEEVDEEVAAVLDSVEGEE